MNKKLIAAAVSAVVIAPVAQAEVAVYGNITNAIVLNDTGADGANSTTDISGVGSRLGVKASSDLGNGMKANGRYEWATLSDHAGEPFDTTRLATVGLSGAFGSVNVGQQWTSFFNNVGTLVSPNYTVGVPHGSLFRTSNTIQYSNSFGPVNLGIDVRLDDDGGDSRDADGEFEGDQRDGQGDGFGIGITFNPISSLKIGIAYDDTDGYTDPEGVAGTDGVGLTAADVATGMGKAEGSDFAGPTHPTNVEVGANDIFGIAGKLNFGNFWVSAGYQIRNQDGEKGIAADGDVNTEGYIPATAGTEKETTYYQLWVGTTIGEKTSLALGYGESTEEADGRAIDTETDQWAFAANHDMGGGFHLFFEHQDGSTSSGGDDVGLGSSKETVDPSKTFLGMRINF